MAAKCIGTTKKGTACRAKPLAGRDVCLAHADQVTRDSAGFGGPQEGAGRPRNPRPSEIAQQIVETNIAAVLRPYFRALGIYLEDDLSVRVEDDEHKLPMKYVWGGPDDPAIPMLDVAAQIQAAERLQDRIYGKPKRAVEISGPDGDPLQHEVTLDDETRELTGELLRRRARSRE